MSSKELKRDYMTKRSHMKRKFTSDNFKSRWFMLFEDCLKYYEGTLEKGPGKEKGVIRLDTVHAIEEADLQPFDANKKHGFQVGYSADTGGSELQLPLVLYVNAITAEQREDWIKVLRAACLAWVTRGHALEQRTSCSPHISESKFHPGIWTGLAKQYSCCGQPERLAPPCLLKTWRIPVNDLGIQVENMDKPPVPLPRLPPPSEVVLRKVIALYDYKSNNANDLDLVKGDEYDILDDTLEQFWWKAKNKSGRTGFIPSNYVVDASEKKTGLDNFPWFFKDIPRQRSESMLRDDGREGCFLVRDSSTSPGSYTLAVFTREVGGGDGPLAGGIVRHYHIKHTAQDQVYLSEKHPQKTVEELITYHKLNAGGLICRLRLYPDEQSAPSTLGLEHGKFVLEVADLKFLEELGKGNFGCVQKALYKGNKTVAVKMMLPNTMQEDEFALEAKNMMMLKHPHLVQLYGFTLKPFYIVTEFMENGCLLHFLKRRRTSLLANAAVLIDICYQVSNAMSYLESKKFIHRDLATRNCLVGKGTTIKVGDFGLSRFVQDDEYISSSGAKFPIKWASPEVLSYMRFSSKSDVWAFGILMWEVFTGGDMPYRKTSNPDVVELVCSKNYKLEKPAYCPREVYDVMMQCWEKAPETRPCFGELNYLLSKLNDDKDYVT